jgi:hypothetical protein
MIQYQQKNRKKYKRNMANMSVNKWYQIFKNLSMQQSLPWKADSYSADQEILRLLYNS